MYEGSADGIDRIRSAHVFERHGGKQPAYAVEPRCPLCPHDNWPSQQRAAKKRDELAPSHGIPLKKSLYAIAKAYHFAAGRRGDKWQPTSFRRDQPDVSVGSLASTPICGLPSGRLRSHPQIPMLEIRLGDQ